MHVWAQFLLSTFVRTAEDNLLWLKGNQRQRYKLAVPSFESFENNWFIDLGQEYRNIDL
jgi:hypothetical protein